MNRINSLKKLVADLKSSNEKNEFKYIGTGNPNADILIIGKEASIHQNDKQKEWEIDNNLEDWYDLTEEDSLPKIGQWPETKYSPLYPYKGQKFNIDRGTNNGGTSPTWYNYQKLINRIYPENNDSQINFHEKVFITEVNSTPSLKTTEADMTSISFRKKKVLSSDFFQSFPVVIVSGLGYFDIQEGRNEIEEIFGVKFQREEHPNGKKTQQYFYHEAEDGRKILINTRQLGMVVSNARLDMMAKEIKNFISE